MHLMHWPLNANILWSLQLPLLLSSKSLQRVCYILPRYFLPIPSLFYSNQPLQRDDDSIKGKGKEKEKEKEEKEKEEKGSDKESEKEKEIEREKEKEKEEEEKHTTVGEYTDEGELAPELLTKKESIIEGIEIPAVCILTKQYINLMVNFPSNMKEAMTTKMLMEKSWKRRERRKRN